MVHGPGGDDEIIATVSGTLVEIADYGLALEVLDGADWRGPIGGNFDNLPEVFLLFDRDVSATAQWRVVNPEVWIFSGGATLQPPLSGNIE